MAWLGLTHQSLVPKFCNFVPQRSTLKTGGLFGIQGHVTLWGELRDATISLDFLSLCSFYDNGILYFEGMWYIPIVNSVILIYKLETWCTSGVPWPALACRIEPKLAL